MYPDTQGDGMTPPPVQGWDGWPVGWSTPNWGSYGFGFHMDDPGGFMSRVSTTMTCVDLNSRQLGSFPVYGFDSRSGTRFDLPSWVETPEPELYADWSEFMKLVVNSYQIYGEVILWATARGADGYPSRFVVLNPERITVEMADGRVVYRAIDRNGDHLENLDPEDLCHIKFQAATESLRGIGPLQWVGRNLVSAQVLEQYGADLARTGVWAVLRHPGNLNADQANDLKQKWAAGRAADPSLPAVLSGGVEFSTLSISPKDMALLDLRVFDEQRIAGAFGVPAYLVGLPQPGGFTYVNACLTDDTEILTGRGWLTVDEVTVDDRVLTLNHETGMSEWQYPSAINVWDVDDGDELVAMNPQGHDSVSTPNHRWPVLRDGGRVWTTTDEMLPTDEIVTAAPLAGLPTSPKYDDAFVELVGWFYTEGHATTGGRVWSTVKQSEVRNPGNVARIRACLTRLFGPARPKGTTDLSYVKVFGDEPSWVEDRRDGMIGFRLNHEATAMIATVVDLDGKVPHWEFVEALTEAQLRLFIDVSIAADGNASQGRKRDGRVFVQDHDDRNDRF